MSINSSVPTIVCTEVDCVNPAVAIVRLQDPNRVCKSVFHRLCGACKTRIHQGWNPTVVATIG